VSRAARGHVSRGLGAYAKRGEDWRETTGRETYLSLPQESHSTKQQSNDLYACLLVYGGFLRSEYRSGVLLYSPCGMLYGMLFGLT